MLIPIFKLFYSKKVHISCHVHGVFEQLPGNHMKGDGCPSCHIQNLQKTVKYTGYLNKVEISCPKHGLFWQVASSHRDGSRCPRCARGGSSYSEQLWLDSLNIPNDQEHRQVWITLLDGQKIKVDGFDKDHNMIYEYLGDYYHGNPKLFSSTEVTYFGKTFGELYDNTLIRFEKIKQSGYVLEYIWASDVKSRQ